MKVHTKMQKGGIIVFVCKYLQFYLHSDPHFISIVFIQLGGILDF